MKRNKMAKYLSRIFHHRKIKKKSRNIRFKFISRPGSISYRRYRERGSRSNPTPPPGKEEKNTDEERYRIY